jgi:hypothetical protein
MHSVRRALTWLGVVCVIVPLTACSQHSAGGASTNDGGNGGGSGGGSSNPLDVTTYHFDNLRTGTNSSETLLTPGNVNSVNFGKNGEYPVDAAVDAQPLYLSGLNIGGAGSHNVLYVATENDTVYALDADSLSGTTATVLWQVNLAPGGEAAVPLASLSCGNNALSGIMGTPVIDRGRNAIYVVAFTGDGGGNFYYRLHALNLASGAELFGGPRLIAASFPGTGGNVQGGNVVFNAAVHQQRAALLEGNGQIYITWSGRYGDCGNYSSWVVAYSADTLDQGSAIDLVPKDSGGGIWMSGAGPAMDASGDIYVVTSNAFVQHGDGTPASGSYANSLVRLRGTGGALQVKDYFAPDDDTALNDGDVDLGSGGFLALPDQTDSNGTVHHLGVLAGKDTNIYVFNRDSLGGYSTAANANLQVIPGQLGGNEFHSIPVYFNGSVYFAAPGLALKSFAVTGSAGLAATPSAQGTQAFGQGIPVISANGTSHGIVWLVDSGPAVLYAFDAASASLLYSSQQAPGGRDGFSTSARSETPIVTDGHVYVGTSTSIARFGPLP